MHGLGNDFIIFDNQKSPKINDANFLRKISDRRFGVGCDPVMIMKTRQIQKTLRLRCIILMEQKLEHVEMDLGVWPAS